METRFPNFYRVSGVFPASCFCINFRLRHRVQLFQLSKNYLTLSGPGMLARGRRGLTVGCCLHAFRQVSVDSSLSLPLSPAGFFLAPPRSASPRSRDPGMSVSPQKPGAFFDWTRSCVPTSDRTRPTGEAQEGWTSMLRSTRSYHFTFIFKRS